ncbi:class I SAM-dependent DNA methyltransferase [Hymenobacter sp. BT491]|uniref:HsdM family class I SAM-dependent methyltransferase n=1 Tax=Hymenobacter sp. BT491 TaxID=2766779 RepID=UPI0016536877|nr:N-6 DNA methylase [Hymenobacter sp. BT491]MBC6992223.1 N-6 DNA methylase [Hymenobacter sp. BT491]
MDRDYGTILSLTSDTLSEQVRARSLEDFAQSFGWVPSDILEEPSLSAVANGHLIVEHGLETSAVISFLRTPFRDLTAQDKKKLISLSYNNLIDWHIQVDPSDISFIYNRAKTPEVVESFRLSRDKYDYLRSNAFDKVTERKPSTNLPSLDNALIKTISNWKRLLSAEMNYDVPNKVLSALFNAIIFARAAEDQYRFRNFVLSNSNEVNAVHFHTLLSTWREGNINTIRELIIQTIHQFVKVVPDFIIDEPGLAVFDDLNKYTVAALLNDFYRNKYATYYDYDFSIISKHALSRIYEGYVSVLRLENSPQGSLFPELPNEERDRAFGSVYTPQYIAKFFAKYIRQSVPISIFKQLKVCDPACGSGIFLRTVLEMQSEPEAGGFDLGAIKNAFSNASGVDVDQNAAHATQLSLSLLYLVLTGVLPSNLDIKSAEAIKYFSANIHLNETYDAVIANPPYVAVEKQTAEMQEVISDFLGPHGKGRVDMYIPFLSIALNILKPGGFGCFVLPHSFLLSENAAPLRRHIAESSIIHCVADLSAVKVFGDVGIYVVLIIFQKNPLYHIGHQSATIVKCQEFPGQALQDVLDDRVVENKFYSVYKADQDLFKQNEWILLPPIKTQLRQKLLNLPKINQFLAIKQGIITGADSVFIRKNDQIPHKEKIIYTPFLRDRDMVPYNIGTSESSVFYPFIEGRKITQVELEKNFPKTWAHLCANASILQKRSSLERYRKEWWEPLWPRSPDKLLIPKIISPHLAFVPRFSWDKNGEYAVSRSTFLSLLPDIYGQDQDGLEHDMLRYFLAILNSSTAFWYLSSNSHIYRGGYLMLEPKNLAVLPVPDPIKANPNTLLELLSLVDLRMSMTSNSNLDEALMLERSIDNIVAELYELNVKEKRDVGLYTN